MNYQELCPQGTPKAERRKYSVGDIRENKAQCLKCGDIIVSKHLHDFVTCKCGGLSVDGGSWYLKRSGTKTKWMEQSIFYEVDNENKKHKGKRGL